MPHRIRGVAGIRSAFARLVCVSSLWSALLALLALLVLGGSAGTAAEDNEAGVQGRYELAQRWTQDWIRQTLDRQLRQLEQNGLSRSELAEELRATRRRVDRLAHEEMGELAVIAARLKSPKAAEPSASAGPLDHPAADVEDFRTFQTRRREVVAALTTERLQIVARRHQAELLRLAQQAWQTQQNVAQIVDAAESLPGSSRDMQLVRGIERQHDAQLLVDELRQVLAAAVQWEGTIAPVAQRGRDYLEALKFSERSQQITHQLEQADVDAVRKDVHELSSALAQLVRVLHERSADEQQLARQIDELQRRQADLQQQLRAIEQQPAAAAPNADAEAAQAERRLSLAEAQLQLEREIQATAAELPPSAAERGPLTAAATAAERAASELFEQEPAKAAAAQDNVQRELARAAEQARLAPDPELATHAEGLKEQGVELQQARQQLDALLQAERALEKQLAEQADARAAGESAEKSRQQQAQQAAIAERLPEIVGNERLPREARQELNAAAQAATAAAGELAKLASQTPPGSESSSGEAARTSVRRTAQHLDQAQAAVVDRMFGVRQRQLLLSLGQAARLSEIVERLAAQNVRMAQAADVGAASDWIQAQQKVVGHVLQLLTPDVMPRLMEPSKRLAAAQRHVPTLQAWQERWDQLIANADSLARWRALLLEQASELKGVGQDLRAQMRSWAGELKQLNSRQVATYAEYWERWVVNRQPEDGELDEELPEKLQQRRRMLAEQQAVLEELETAIAAHLSQRRELDSATNAAVDKGSERPAGTPARLAPRRQDLTDAQVLRLRRIAEEFDRSLSHVGSAVTSLAPELPVEPVGLQQALQASSQLCPCHTAEDWVELAKLQAARRVPTGTAPWPRSWEDVVDAYQLGDGWESQGAEVTAWAIANLPLEERPPKNGGGGGGGSSPQKGGGGGGSSQDSTEPSSQSASSANGGGEKSAGSESGGGSSAGQGSPAGSAGDGEAAGEQGSAAGATSQAAPGDNEAEDASAGDATQESAETSQGAARPPSEEAGERGEAQGGGGGKGAGDAEPAPVDPLAGGTPGPAGLPGSPWFAELPPGAREAVRAAGQRGAPARYQDSLRRYFSNVTPGAAPKRPRKASSPPTTPGRPAAQAPR